MKTYKHLIAACTAAALAMAASYTAHAQQQFPTKPIRLIVPFSAGSVTDILARLIGQKMSESWGQQVVVDNRPGAGAIVGSQALLASNPDGHTLMMVSNAHAISATLYSKLPYDTVRDFAAISQVASGSVVWVVSKDLGVKTLKELIALAKSRPGKIDFGTAGVGSASHIQGELLKMETGIDVRHVAYKGPVEAMTDTIGGRIGIALVGPAAAAPFIKDGRAVALGVSTAARTPMLPNVPTIAEAGVPGHEFDVWFGMFAPAKTPRAVVAQLSKEVARIVELPEVKERMSSFGSVPKSSTPEQFDAFVRSEVQKLGKVIRAANVRIE